MQESGCRRRHPEDILSASQEAETAGFGRATDPTGLAFRVFGCKQGLHSLTVANLIDPWLTKKQNRQKATLKDRL